jgi:(1->4)-alpha-D-glucan 1-alpha-D-glucosylmutase
VYTSPYLTAAPGSTHGYDVVDHSRVNPELGGADGHTHLGAAIRAHGLGHVVDVVPNHMSISSADNVWWWDVLENGPSSRYAGYFDVDWDPPESRLRNTVLLPVLGDHYGRVVEARAFTLHRDGVRFSIRYGEHAFPVSPRSLGGPLARAAHASGSRRLAFVADVLDALPMATATDSASVGRRHRDKEVAEELLSELFEADVSTRLATDRAIEAINADPDQMDALLEQRTTGWRGGAPPAATSATGDSSTSTR